MKKTDNMSSKMHSKVAFFLFLTFFHYTICEWTSVAANDARLGNLLREIAQSGIQTHNREHARPEERLVLRRIIRGLEWIDISIIKHRVIFEASNPHGTSGRYMTEISWRPSRMRFAHVLQNHDEDDDHVVPSIDHENI